MNEELIKLKAKLLDDQMKSEHRIGLAQKEVQELVQERRELRKKFESEDALLEGSISELVQEIASIQSRALVIQELIKTLETTAT